MSAYATASAVSFKLNIKLCLEYYLRMIILKQISKVSSILYQALKTYQNYASLRSFVWRPNFFKNLKHRAEFW